MLRQNQDFSFNDNLFIRNTNEKKILGPEALRAITLFSGLCQMFCSAIALRGHNDTIVQILKHFSTRINPWIQRKIYRKLPKTI